MTFIGLKKKVAEKKVVEKISQTEIAKRLKISRQHLSNIMRDRRKPTIDNLEAFAEYFDCSIAELYEE